MLGADEYHGCDVVAPDADIVLAVAADPGAIGHISFAFLDDRRDVKPLAVDGQAAVQSNPDYPIRRPLYLLWWHGRTRVADFVTWAQEEEARTVLMRRFMRPSRSVEGR